MSERQQRGTSPMNEDAMPWWIPLCRWLWRLSAYLGGTVLFGLALNVVASWLITSKGFIPEDSPLGVFLKHWPPFLAVGCCFLFLAAFLWAISHKTIPSDPIRERITSRDRERMLRRLRVRYEQMLTQTLQGTTQIELGLAIQNTAIQNTSSLFLRLPKHPEQVLPPQTSIFEVYEQHAQQELLILGAPGAGKTTLLLELAQHLVEQAEQQSECLLPVLLPLSSWAVKRPPLQEWLIEQCALLYDIPQELSQRWVQAGMVLPLLDGLDEMEEAARPACIAAINAYHREHLEPLVVCSRSDEYETAARQEKLALHTAVVVQPLQLAHIETYLVALGKPLAALRAALRKSSALQEIATTPLILQVLLLTYRGTSVRHLAQKAPQLQQQIWNDYVQRMISHKGDAKRYSLVNTTRWLSWLAMQMRKHSQTNFFLETLQPTWLPSKRTIMLYRWSIGLVAGLSTGLVAGLVVGMIQALLVNDLRSETIWPVNVKHCPQSWNTGTKIPGKTAPRQVYLLQKL